MQESPLPARNKPSINLAKKKWKQKGVFKLHNNPVELWMMMLMMVIMMMMAMLELYVQYFI